MACAMTCRRCGARASLLMRLRLLGRWVCRDAAHTASFEYILTGSRLRAIRLALRARARSVYTAPNCNVLILSSCQGNAQMLELFVRCMYQQVGPVRKEWCRAASATPRASSSYGVAPKSEQSANFRFNGGFDRSLGLPVSEKHRNSPQSKPPSCTVWVGLLLSDTFSCSIMLD